MSFTRLADITPTLNEESLRCAFPTIERYGYLRRAQPDLVILAARPGHGKTALACQLAMEVSKHSHVAFFSLEMSKEQLKTRQIAQDADRSIKSLKYIPAAELANKVEYHSRLNFDIDDTNGLDVHELCQRALALNDENPIDLLVVDYLQIVASEGKRSKTEEIGYVTERLKTLAKRLGCPVLALAQMSRAIESRRADARAQGHDPRMVIPTMSDLADSSSLEKWADVILFLDKDQDESNEVTVHVAKNRHGEAKEFTMKFSGSILKFYDAAPGEII